MLETLECGAQNNTFEENEEEEEGPHQLIFFSSSACIAPNPRSDVRR